MRARPSSLRGLLSRLVIVLTLVLAALVTAAVVGIGLASNEYRTGEIRAVAREKAANQLLVDLLNAETGNRGYALTGRLDYLDPYTQAKLRYGRDLGNLRGLLSGEPTLQQAADAVDRTALLWFDEAKTLIALRRAGRFSEAIDRINTGIARQRLQAFRVEQANLIAEVERLRTESLSRADGRRTLTVVLVVIAALVALGVVALLSRRLWRRVGGPVGHLAAGVRRVSAGKLTEPVPASPRAVTELAALTAGFNEMQGQIVREREAVDQAARREAAQDAERTLWHTVQGGLLPARLPSLGGFRVAARYAPAEEGLLIGGDFYDAMALPDGRLALVVGDVSGHGAAAAARAAGLRFAWRTLVELNPAPKQVMSALNAQLGDPEDRAEGHFVTMLYALVDRTGIVELSPAGHSAPLLLTHSDCHPIPLSASGPILGVFDRVDWPVVRAELPLGGTLVLYTDGLVEARRGSELFGLDRACAALVAERREALELRLERLVDAARRFDASHLSDDLVVLGVERPALPEGIP